MLTIWMRCCFVSIIVYRAGSRRRTNWLIADFSISIRLVGMRVEDERVFADTHELILKWLRCDQLDGVRVDHPDGLRDPAQYFHRLRSAAGKPGSSRRKFFNRGEELPESWDIAGTTGLRFSERRGRLVHRSARRSAVQ